MQNQTGDGNDKVSEVKRPSDQEIEKPNREKDVSTSQPSSNEPEIEKSVQRQPRTEVQNPLMHESY